MAFLKLWSKYSKTVYHLFLLLAVGIADGVVLLVLQENMKKISTLIDCDKTV